ncbi:MAG: HlyD family efflux transporter periplasmic adaptor subunit, partial [Clostridia bacterium]
MNKKYLILLFILILLGSYIYKVVTKEKIDVVTACKHQISIQDKAYILSNETVANYDKNKVLMPISEDLKRVSKGDIIGVYKNADYDLKQKNISEMDSEIKSKLMLNTNVYSNEIIEIENKIHQIITKIDTTSSYIKMNDYKNKLDELAYRKAIAISSLTPNGDEIKKLINKRDEYVKSIKNVSDNLKAVTSGVVVYKLDNLENKFNINDYSINNIKSIIETYDKINDTNFGVKIVDNYNSKIMVKTTDTKNINKNYEYEVLLVDENYTTTAVLEEIIKDNENNYLIFNIKNGLENIIN